MLAALPVVFGIALLAVGGVLVVWTIALFVRVGRGTLAPWDPTSTLVVEGPYRHVRNPMISGVLFLLLGEAALLGSWPLLAWFAAVAAVNAVYLPLVEEPGSCAATATSTSATAKTCRAGCRGYVRGIRPAA